MRLVLAFLLVLPGFIRAAELGKPADQARNPINDLAQLIRQNQSKAAAQDIADRVARWVMEKEGGDYLYRGLRKDSVRAAAFQASLKEAVGRLSRENPGDAAVLFFVLGSGRQAPAWVRYPELAKALSQSKTERLKTFLNSMDSWTGKDLGRGNAEQELALFLPEAVARAYKVFEWPRVKKEFVADFPLGAGSLLAPDPVAGGGGRNKDIYNPAKGFGWESLYGSLEHPGGALVVEMTAPGEKASRLISIKVYTTKDEKTGAMVDQLGIFDITYPGDSFGRRFDLGQTEAEGKKIALDTDNPKAPKYALAMTASTDGDMLVSLRLEGLNGKKGTTVTTSLNELYRKRAQQAVDEGGNIKVGGKEFIVLGQGGAKGSLLFFPADIKERMANGENVKPELAALVNERSSDGRNVNLADPRPLGSVSGKPYELVFDNDLKYWVAQEAPPKKETGEGDSSTPTKKTDDLDSTSSGDEVEANILKKGEYELNADVAKGLDAKWGVKVYDWKAGLPSKPVQRRHLMVLPASIRPERAAFVYFHLPPGYDESIRLDREVRGVGGKYLAVTSKNYTVYQDVSQRADPSPPGSPDKIFKYDEDCLVDEGKKALCVADVVLLDDALGRIGFGFPERVEAGDNAQRAVGDLAGKPRKYSIKTSASRAGGLDLVVEETKVVPIWPRYEPADTSHLEAAASEPSSGH